MIILPRWQWVGVSWLVCLKSRSRLWTFTLRFWSFFFPGQFEISLSLVWSWYSCWKISFSGISPSLQTQQETVAATSVPSLSNSLFFYLPRKSIPLSFSCLYLYFATPPSLPLSPPQPWQIASMSTPRLPHSHRDEMTQVCLGRAVNQQHTSGKWRTGVVLMDRIFTPPAWHFASLSLLLSGYLKKKKGRLVHGLSWLEMGNLAFI